MRDAAAVRVLVACEKSGVVREAFNAMAGIHAMSCDLEPCEDGRSDYHIRGDVLDVLDDGWDLMICHPPCRYLSSSGLHWNRRRPGRTELTEKAVEFALALWNAKIPMVALENPVGLLSTRIRLPDQIIQPWQFGDDASKATCLWLSGLPNLKPTKYVSPRFVADKPRWSNQTDSGQNRLPPSAHRASDRARTYPGIARAMADQWGSL